MSKDVFADFSALDDLNRLLEAAVKRTAKARADELNKTAEKVRDQAAAIAASYPKGTGALAANVTVTGTALTRRVGSDLREGWFLEFGSPNTGAPRPWLTGPAGRGAEELLAELGKAAAPW